MATIPTADNIGRRVEPGQAPIARARPDVSSGIKSLSSVLGGIANSATQYQVAQAASEFMTRKVKEDGSYDQDQDYGTIEDRYTENISTILNESAGLISNGRARNEFIQRYSVDVAQGIERIREVAFGKEKDHQRAYINQQLEGFREAGLTGDVSSVMDTATGLLASARNSGYISAQEEQDMDSTFRNDLAQANLRVMSPEQRLAAMGQPWAENIPLDIRVRITEEAEKEIVTEKAIANVDEYMADIIIGGSRQTIQPRIQSIKDPDIREETERRFENEYNRYIRNTQQVQNGLHQKYYLQVRSGEIGVDDIPLVDRERMEPSVLSSLYSAEGQFASGQSASTVSSRSALFDLYSMKAMVDAGNAAPGELFSLVVESAPSLGQQDYKEWVQIATEGIVPPDVDSLMTAKEGMMTRLNAMDEAGVLQDDVDIVFNKMYVELDSWYRGVQASTGKPPSGAEQQQKIDRLLLDARWLNRVGWGGSLQWRDFNDEERKRYVDREVRRLQNGGRREQALYRVILSALPEEFTPDQFMELYTQLK